MKKFALIFAFAALAAGVLLASTTPYGYPYIGGVEVVGPVSADGNIEVELQDQYTDLVDLYFIKALGTPTTLAADVDIEDTTITLTDSTGFVDGVTVGVFSSGGDFDFATQIGAPIGNTIELDTPVDFAFSSGDNVIAATKNLAVDGSTETQVFSIGPIGASIDLEIDITRITGYIQDEVAMDDNTFGGITSLNYGVVLRSNNGSIKNIWNVKSNGEMAIICASDLFYTTKAPAGSYGLRFRNTFGGQEKHGVTVRVLPGQALEILVQDDLSDLQAFYVMAQGHVVSK